MATTQDPMRIGWISRNKIHFHPAGGAVPVLADYHFSRAVESGGRPGIPDYHTDIELEYLIDAPKKDRGYNKWQVPLAALEETARTSKRQWRALLLLSVMWHKVECRMVAARSLRKKRYLFATVKEGSANPRAELWLPELSSNDLAMLCYPIAEDLMYGKNERSNARKNIHSLHVKGHIHILDTEADRWQIGRPFAPPWARISENQPRKTADKDIKPFGKDIKPFAEDIKPFGKDIKP